MTPPPSAEELVYLKCSGSLVDKPELNTASSPHTKKQKHTHARTQNGLFKNTSLLARLICSYVAPCWLYLFTAGLPERPALFQLHNKPIKFNTKKRKQPMKTMAHVQKKNLPPVFSPLASRFKVFGSRNLSFFSFFFLGAQQQHPTANLKTKNPPPTCLPSVAFFLLSCLLAADLHPSTEQRFTLSRSTSGALCSPHVKSASLRSTKRHTRKGGKKKRTTDGAGGEGLRCFLPFALPLS